MLSRIDYLEKQLAFQISKTNNRQTADPNQQVFVLLLQKYSTYQTSLNVCLYIFSTIVKHLAEENLKQMLNTLRENKFEVENEAKVD